MGRRLSAGILAAALSAGCAVRVPPPAAPARAPEGDPWRGVLQRFVDAQGRVDFAGIAREPAALDAAVARVAAEKPPASATPWARLAWYLNAYEALAMYGVIRAGIPQELASQRVEFFDRNRYLVGGEWLSLAALENERIRPLGDARVHFALNRMVRGSGPLPREPFEASRLDSQLEAAARQLLSNARYVRLEKGRRVVGFSEVLHWYQADFLAAAPSLIAYANRFRDDPIPADWTVEFFGYDWTVNRQ
ncbi:MAG TPA: DUF547 domain-containing protein [Thermoanaerobaculia bacterium]|nr:DUF547 domain-containing protein [Thermoanaerobaculia bacterium]